MFKHIHENKCGLFLLGDDYISDIFLEQKNNPDYFWDQHNKKFYDEHIDKNSVVIDVGANIGTETIYFGKIAKKVYSFEPQRYFYYQLCGNLFINNLINVEAFNLACSDKEEYLQTPELIDYLNHGNNGTSCMLRDPHSENFETIKSVKLDSFLGVDTKIDFIKIDSQGFDLQIMKGAKRIINKYKPKILFEIMEPENLNKLNIKTEDYFFFLEEIGYKYKHIIGDRTSGDFFAYYSE